MSIKEYPSVDYVRQCLREENGHLFWLVRPREHFPNSRICNTWNSRFSGKEAGCVTVYVNQTIPRCVVVVKNILIPRPIIIWAIHKNEWRLWLDHKNRNSIDDRIENLRPATPAQNSANTKIRSDNRSGHKGVSWDKANNKWRVNLCVNGKNANLGRYDDLDEAIRVRNETAKRLLGEFAADGHPNS